jgi:hypothetical protein
MPGKKFSESRSGLCPSEKEFPGRRSDAFHHKNAPEVLYCIRVETLQRINVPSKEFCCVVGTISLSLTGHNIATVRTSELE